MRFLNRTSSSSRIYFESILCFCHGREGLPGVALGAESPAAPERAWDFEISQSFGVFVRASDFFQDAFLDFGGVLDADPPGAQIERRGLDLSRHVPDHDRTDSRH